ncbi:hypothetical protein Clacol_006872 [Clathrus columnatus]|uniref:Uncharacterized protein n=1 Tax=Clathrus columnatus TaxID=1419009 RepID=A0AAV5ADB2_9AGAM|nr:hypothetical protein Clacol_006872 [Clathrus columnatus]
MDYDEDAAPPSLLREGLRRREPSSESGVDDYDLAAYSNTLRKGQENIYPPQSPSSQPTGRFGEFKAGRENLDYPPSPIISRPFLTDDYVSSYPPSPSLSYNQNPSSSRRYPVDPRNLPTFLAPLSPQAASRFPETPDSLAVPRSPVAESMDISQFPAFSRAWYEKPSYPRNSSKHSDGSGLPWNMGHDSSGSSTAIDPITKRERIRMLEHEFGKEAEVAQTTRPILGSVDANGNLITAGPKKRAIARWFQALLALAGGASAIYGALFIKPKSPAPPTSTPPAFVLYGVFVLSFCLSVYLFVIRPCCGKRNKANPLDPAGNGMFVLPVQGFPGQQKKTKKKGKGSQSGDVHINLIIDPRMLQQGEREELGAEDDITSSHASTSRTQQSRNRRRNVFEGLALENQWKQARSSLKFLFTLDIICLVVWCAAFVYVLFGKKCPPGQFDGWCTSYNIAIACACFLCIAFGFSVFFDIVDLHASRVSPRTRT